MHVADIPMKREVYSVASRRLTPEELDAVAYSEVYDGVRVWLDDRRNWPTFEQFLGFHIGQALFRYQLTQDQFPAFIAKCNELCRHIGEAHPLGDPEHTRRAGYEPA